MLIPHYNHILFKQYNMKNQIFLLHISHVHITEGNSIWWMNLSPTLVFLSSFVTTPPWAASKFPSCLTNNTPSVFSAMKPQKPNPFLQCYHGFFFFKILDWTGFFYLKTIFHLLTTSGRLSCDIEEIHWNETFIQKEKFLFVFPRSLSYVFKTI